MAEAERKAVHAVLAPDLRLYLVWVPAIPGDSLATARLAAARFPDPRIRHFWDEGWAFGRQVGRLLKLPGEFGKPGDFGPGWDVFLLYDRDAAWSAGGLPRPATWMHTLMGVVIPGVPLLDAPVLRRRVEELLRK